MEILDFWTPADALAFRCGVAEVGTLKAANVSRETQPGNDGLRDDVREARLYAPRALRALARIMEEDSPRAAVEAAKEILRRAYGDPVQPAPAPLPSPAQPATLADTHPDWLAAQRLAYRAGEYDSPDGQPLGRQCLPRQ